MPRFFYQARNKKGQLVTGHIESEDSVEARVLLRARYLEPLKVTQISGGARAVVKVSGKVSSRDLQIFTRQLSTLISAGIPILDALKILSEGKKSPALKEALQKIKISIEQGKR